MSRWAGARRSAARSPEPTSTRRLARQPSARVIADRQVAAGSAAAVSAAAAIAGFSSGVSAGVAVRNAQTGIESLP